ncbi:MAG: hypothetical protein ACK5MU_03235 [Candidatus Saccharimonadales bacterium]
MSEQTTNKTIEEKKGPVVYLSVGAGTKPREVDWVEGDTVETILNRANVVVEKGKVPTLGKLKVKNPAKTPVVANDVIVVEGKPGNGRG